VLTADTFEDPVDPIDNEEPKRSFSVSYLRIRMWVGVLGFALPTTLFLLDWGVLKGGYLFRGSLSAYYHSGARDVFVGVLCITGFMLILYMSGQRSSQLEKRESKLSTIAGSAALLVALFPTKRSGLAPTEPFCGPDSDPVPEGCTRVQQLLGETTVASFHFLCAGLFILALALICLLVFAKSEETKGHQRARFHRLCGWMIVAAVLWVVLGGVWGLEIFGWTPLLVGEVVSVYFFAVSWILRSHDLLPDPIAKGLKLLRLA
jgi:Protein of unknown function (DUF998)